MGGLGYSLMAWVLALGFLALGGFSCLALALGFLALVSWLLALFDLIGNNNSLCI